MSNSSFSARDGAIVVTSIAAPNPVLRSLAEGAARCGLPFIVTGDTKSPAEFELDGCRYYGIAAQEATGLEYAALCPTRSYTRKNIAYLLAIREGVDWIAETDDDNFPRESFWEQRVRETSGDLTSAPSHPAWCNVYTRFSKKFVYPRGFPIELLHEAEPEWTVQEWSGAAPIQQGLADDNPDVDAIYRMLYPLPLVFDKRRPLVLDHGVWCPFNSQNTTFFREAFPLLYLPAHCSFRMTDIWRSYVAQRVMIECGWRLMFHEATVWQERNAHNLLRDFEDEIPGYLNNRRIVETLSALTLQPGVEAMGENLTACYQALVDLGVVGAAEMPLLAAWLQDLRNFAV